MEARPKIKLELTTADTTIEIVGWFLIVAVWGLTITNYSNLPDTIPIHYNGAGQADGFGGKATILTLPLIATILFIGVTILNKFPHVFNYPTNITQDNAFRQYTNATRLIRYLIQDKSGNMWWVRGKVFFGLTAIGFIKLSRMGHGSINKIGRQNRIERKHNYDLPFNTSV